MTGEHLWPKWMHPYLPKTPNAKNWTAIASETPHGKKTTRKKPRPGHVYTKKIKVVCKKCNETWMGDIEELAKPILVPIIQGKHALLDHDSQVTLATWLTLKFLVADHDKDATTPIASKGILTAFKQHRKIPERMKIWITRHNEFQWSAGFWSRGMVMSLSPKPPVGRLRKNVQTVAFGAGHLFSIACLSMTERINLELEINNPFTTQLWPSDFSTIDWPTPLTPLGAIGNLANVLDELESDPRVKWGSLYNS